MSIFIFKTKKKPNKKNILFEYINHKKTGEEGMFIASLVEEVVVDDLVGVVEVVAKN